MSLPTRDDAKKALSTNIKKQAIVDFFETWINWLNKEFNKTIDFLIWSQGPKAYMITKDISDYEISKIKESSDIVP